MRSVSMYLTGPDLGAEKVTVMRPAGPLPHEAEIPVGRGEKSSRKQTSLRARQITDMEGWYRAAGELFGI